MRFNLSTLRKIAARAKGFNLALALTLTLTLTLTLALTLTQSLTRAAAPLSHSEP